jgi:hypothetical protein
MAEPHSIISREEDAELQRLYMKTTPWPPNGCPMRCGPMMGGFLEEEERVADIVRRIKEILG